jgi:hypothetical protein
MFVMTFDGFNSSLSLQNFLGKNIELCYTRIGNVFFMSDRSSSDGTSLLRLLGEYKVEDVARCLLNLLIFMSDRSSLVASDGSSPFQ